MLDMGSRSVRAIEKVPGRGAGSGSFSLPDPACQPLASRIVPTDQDPGTRNMIKGPVIIIGCNLEVNGQKT